MWVICSIVVEVIMFFVPIPRSVAKERGLKTYFSGSVCKFNNIFSKSTSSANCLCFDCRSAKLQKQKQKRDLICKPRVLKKQKILIKQPKLNFETVLLRLYKKFGFVDYDFSLFTEYNSFDQKVLRTCNTCLSTVPIALNSLLSKRPAGCKVCHIKRLGKQTVSSYEDTLKNVFSNLSNTTILNLPLPENVTQKHLVLSFKCHIHGVGITTLAKKLANGNKYICNECSKQGSVDKRSIHSKYFTEDGFIEKAKEIYNSQYTYSNFVSFYTDLEITCKDHGTFLQTPYNHIIRGNSCIECNPKGFSRSDFIKVAERKGAAYLYCLKLSKNLFKIGITTTFIDRFSAIKVFFKDVSSLLLVKGDPEFIYNLETNLHNQFHAFQNRPTISFAGYTECFSSVDGIEEYIPFDQVEVITNNLKEVKYENDKVACAA